ncbi:hypothetical protein GCM10020256_23350 [Streptomyces thermocoprophilus]
MALAVREPREFRGPFTGDPADDMAFVERLLRIACQQQPYVRGERVAPLILLPGQPPTAVRLSCRPTRARASAASSRSASARRFLSSSSVALYVSVARSASRNSR